MHSQQQCPAREECHKCGKKGHFKVMCCTCEAVSTVESNKDDPAFKGVVQQLGPAKPWSIALFVNSSVVEFKTDIGADVSLISQSMFRNIPDATL